MLDREGCLYPKLPREGVKAFFIMDEIFNLLKDKKQAISYVLGCIQESNKQSAGLKTLLESISREDNPNLSAPNLIKIIKTTTKVSAIQADFIKNLAIIALVHMSSSGFDAEIAQLMIKFGKGEDAIKQMFKNKMEGN